MTAIEKELLEALHELQGAARGTEAGRAARSDLSAMIARLDLLTGRLPRETDSDLLHYMHRKSYEKARLLLEARQVGSA